MDLAQWNCDFFFYINESLFKFICKEHYFRVKEFNVSKTFAQNIQSFYKISAYCKYFIYLFTYFAHLITASVQDIYLHKLYMITLIPKGYIHYINIFTNPSFNLSFLYKNIPLIKEDRFEDTVLFGISKACTY